MYEITSLFFDPDIKRSLSLFSDVLLIWLVCTAMITLIIRFNGEEADLIQYIKILIIWLRLFIFII